MNRLLYLGLIVFFVSCGKEKVILLPETTSSEITEIRDVSAAYLFYDETKTDSVELNRKNLISTTNWLVNIDKRLTLKQVIPHIQFLQNKKRNAEIHKNEDAKNFYSCNNTRIKNLSFIEFTDVFYHLDETAENYIAEQNNKRSIINFSKNSIRKDNIFITEDSLVQIIIQPHTEDYQLILSFNKALSFQEYITIKSKLSVIENSKSTINMNEFIY